jgi:hypothetical protein
MYSITGRIRNWAHARRAFVSLLALVLLGSVVSSSLTANEIETYAFEKVWWRTDLPVRELQTNRTWIWGPQPISPLLVEPYDEGFASGREGARWVQYFDKTRVEITRSDRNRDDAWYVTNGLLARELITGRMQIGDANSVQYDPAPINVAGDGNDPNAPTYASLNHVREAAPLPAGTVVTQTIARDGSIGDNPDLAEFQIQTSPRVDSTERTIASVFWSFMNSEGTIYDGFEFVDGRLFQDPFFATGLPITEPYWATVRVGGEPKNVLIQAFERRVLTYTPDNPDGWRVEAGNVGRHYYQWRYTDNGDPALAATELSTRRDLSGNLIFMGEVVNNAKAPFGEVEIELTIKHDHGEPIRTFRTFLDSSMIEAGERFPFQIWTEYSGEFARYEISMRSRPSHRFNRPEISIETTSNWASNNRYEVRGSVRNESNHAVDYPQYIVALYSEDGQIIDYRWGLIEPVTLEPGQEASFETFFFDPGRFHDYRVFVTD